MNYPNNTLALQSIVASLNITLKEKKEKIYI